MTGATERQIEKLLHLEMRLVDEQRWDEWLELFDKDVVFWVPAWDGEHDLTSDPNTEMSLIFYDSRQGLEDRVYRLRTGRSSASLPMPRTTHFITNVMVDPIASDKWEVFAAWQTLLYRNGETTQFFGHYHYLFAEGADGLKIARKKVILMNDRIPTVLDIYSL